MEPRRWFHIGPGLCTLLCLVAITAAQAADARPDYVIRIRFTPVEQSGSTNNSATRSSAPRQALPHTREQPGGLETIAEDADGTEDEDLPDLVAPAGRSDSASGARAPAGAQSRALVSTSNP